MPITGVAYYPEHWNEAHWPEDARLMREAGLSVVRLAEFAWDKIEPEEGEFNWAWLDKAIEVLTAEALKIVLCTPTPTPPPWLTRLHPDICRVREDGVRISPGARRHATANSPAYLQHSRRIVEAITQRYGNHPDVIGWQVDNEFGCGETTRSYGEHDKAAFHRWLQEQYHSLEALNEAWGTQFWGMTYYTWEEIPIPGITTEPQSPSMRLDYRRFSSDAWVRFQRMQIEIIRQHSPGRFVTHNFMVRHWSLDYWKLAQDLDFVSYDNYPHGLRGPAEVAMNHDLMWAFKRRSFWVMEQQPGQVNWHPFNPPVPPGQVRAWSHQAVAHGAEAIIYFRWRAARFGTEQRHGGLLKWDRSIDQCYVEAQQVAQEFQQLPPKVERQPSKIGIVFDYNDLWSIELEPHTNEFSYWELVYEIYHYFWQANIPIDFLPRNADPAILDQYDLIVLPAGVLHHVGEADTYQAWVEKGNSLVITFRTAVRSQSNVAVDMSLPAAMSYLIGARVSHWGSCPPAHYHDWPLHRPGTVAYNSEDDAEAYEYKIWAEALEPIQAKPMLTYGDGMLQGKTAATIHRLGQGEVIYLGCWVKDFACVFDPQPQDEFEQVTLKGDNGSQWQVTINHASQPFANLDPLDVLYREVGDE
jgi:beta-galactosidase